MKSKVLLLLLININLFLLDWRVKDFDNSGSRKSEETGFDENISLAWTFHPAIEAPVYATPLVVEGIVLLVQQNGKIYALSESSGAPIWQKSLFEEIIATPVIEDGKIYILTKSCNLFILDLFNGFISYKKLFEGTCLDPPAKESNFLYISLGFPKNRLIKFNLNTFAVEKEFFDELGQPLYATSRINGDAIYVTSTSGYLYKLDKNNLTTLWKRFHSSIITGWNVSLEEGAFYFFPGGNDLRVYKYNSSTNELIWSKALTISKPSFKVQMRHREMRRMGIPYEERIVGGSQKPSGDGGMWFAPQDAEPSASASNFAQDNNSICFITGLPAYYLFCQDKQNGNFIATVFLGANTGILPIGAPVIKDNLVFYALPVDDKLFIADKNGTLKGTYQLNGSVYANIVAANSKIFVATSKGSLYALKTSLNSPPSTPVITSPAQYEKINTTEITIVWQASDANNDPLTYTLKVVKGNEVNIYSNLTQPSFVLTNLAINTQYTLQVRAIDNKGAYSPWSQPVTFFSRKIEDVSPPPPVNLQVTPTLLPNGKSNFTVTWQAPDAIGIIGYKFTYRKEGENFFNEIFLTQTSYNLTNDCNSPSIFGCLAENEYYEVSVKTASVDNLESIPVTKKFFSGTTFLINGTPALTNDLQVVLDNANTNDTIQIKAANLTLFKPVIINKPVKIKGDGALHTILNFGNLDKGFVITSISLKSTFFKPDVLVEISDLTIIGATVGIEINASTRVKNCVIAKGGTGIIANSSSEIINVTIALNSLNGLSINSGEHLIKNNIIVENTGKGISLSGGTINLLKYNVISYNLAGNVSEGITVDETNLIDVRVDFLDVSNNDFREKEGSDSVDSGDPQDDYQFEPFPNGGRINCGAFGNTIYATRTIISQKGGAGGGGGCFLKPQYNDHSLDFIFIFLILLPVIFTGIKYAIKIARFC